MAKIIFPIVASVLLCSSCQQQGVAEPSPATAQQVQAYKQLLMTENYIISYRAYSPNTLVHINERTPLKIREQITKIACDYQELHTEKRQDGDYYGIYFNMQQTLMGISVNIRMKDSPIVYIATTAESATFSDMNQLFPPAYFCKEPCSLLFLEKLPLVLDFYQLKLREGEQIINAGGELEALVFHPKKPIKGHRFSQIRIGLSYGMITDPERDKLWPKNISKAYAGPIEFIY